MAVSSRFWGVASGLAAGALWGLVFLAPKVVPEASPLLLTAGRYLAYGLIAVLLSASRWRRVTAALTRKAWGALVWLSLAGNLVYFAFLAVRCRMGLPISLPGTTGVPAPMTGGRIVEPGAE